MKGISIPFQKCKGMSCNESPQEESKNSQAKVNYSSSTQGSQSETITVQQFDNDSIVFPDS